MVKTILRSAVVVSLSAFFVGCDCGLSCSVAAQENPPADDGLYATVWIQTAGEYAALSRQAYSVAAISLEKALADASWTAATEQAGRDVSALPPAIIVDVDETVLDNSPYQARLILNQEGYSEETWNEWVAAAEAEPLAGAVEFLQAASKRGVTVFYVTNRHVSGEAATRANLLATGFPVDDSRDVLLLKGENEWTSDKTARRQLVAKDFRIILLCGDDLNDFVPARTTDPAPRKEIVKQYAAWFGERWIVLPNPTYGSWEASLFGRDYSLSPESRREKTQGHLRPW